MKSKKSVSMKAVVVLMALVLLIGCGVGGTLAWLMDKTDVVENTFTIGKVDISLIEHSYNPDQENKVTETVSNENNYPLIPGEAYGKDPTVYVSADSEDCYLFIKVEEINDPDSFLDYTLNMDGWTDLSTVTPGTGEKEPIFAAGVTVYYRQVSKNDTVRSWQLLKGDETYTTGLVTVKETVTNSNMPTAEKQPQLKFTAYAAQQDNLTVIQAWTEVQSATPYPTP